MDDCYFLGQLIKLNFNLREFLVVNDKKKRLFGENYLNLIKKKSFIFPFK